MTGQQTAGPQGVRAATGAPAGPDLASLATVHVGQSVVLLRTAAGDLVPVTSWRHGLVPRGLCLPGAHDFAVLAARASRHPVLDLRSWQPALAATPPTDLTVRSGPVDAVATRALARAALGRTPRGEGGPPRPAEDGGPMDPMPLRRRARTLAGTAAHADAADVAEQLEALVGVGPGSTPAGDDVVVGVLAGLDRRADAGARRAGALIRHALPRLLGRTTSVSRHDLAAAARGEVAERVHRLLAAVGDRALVPAAVRAAGGWGATSGLDLAAGVAAGAQASGAPLGAPAPGPLDRAAPLCVPSRTAVARRSA